MIGISLGSNLGHRLNNIQTAFRLVKERCLKNTKESIVIETKALLLPNSPEEWGRDYLNAVIVGDTELSPHDLLKALKDIEHFMGRPKEYKQWSPRLIDLDILFYQDQTINDEHLTIPHREFCNRDFFKHLLALMDIHPWNYTQKNCSVIERSFVTDPLLVGIVNITQDSFSDGGLWNDPYSAQEHIHTLMRDGATVIELGAQSTRPQAIMQSEDSEYAKLESILSLLKPSFDKDNLILSLDTFHPKIAVDLATRYPLSIINDVKGCYDNESLTFLGKKGLSFCFMHALSIPPEAEITLPSDKNPVDILIEWGYSVIERWKNLGLDPRQVILDPGIGFGKTSYQNLSILKKLPIFYQAIKTQGARVMLGHSRKSYIRSFSESKTVIERDIETMALSLVCRDAVDYLRVHNVRDHQRALVADTIIRSSP